MDSVMGHRWAGDQATMGTKPRLSVYWASSCGGCEVAILNLQERLLDVDAAFDLVFCPCLMDTKRAQVEAMPDASIDLTLFNGAIRTSENVEMARLLRRKSKVMVAFGACAFGGGVPGLANMDSSAELMATTYHRGPTIDNPDGVEPTPLATVPEGELELPAMCSRVHNLADVVDVDYSMPGCPPEPHQIWAVLDAISRGVPLPPRGSVLGAGDSSVCDECPRTRNNKKITDLKRVWQVEPDPDLCLLEQGLLCVGVATRSGCGALCPQVQMPCIGCYGAPEGVVDQGAKMVAALGSMIDIATLKELDHAEALANTDVVAGGLIDLIGSCYMFGLPGSIMRASVRANSGSSEVGA